MVSLVSQLLLWHTTHEHRVMPWKATKDPYKIWLSEIILQQTRVAQGLKYYEKFVAAYPNITALANATDQAVYKLWEGLGYYNRCKNMLHTARYIAAQGGVFPTTYMGILALKGIGPYTAAAIASFAYNLPHAVVDGNVYRVLSRYYGIHTPIDSKEGVAAFTALAHKLLPKPLAGKYNQAIMDFGATVCKPKLPMCSVCPVMRSCVGYSTQSVLVLPVKIHKTSTLKLYYCYIVLQHEQELLVHLRTANDIWQGLYEFVLVPLSSNMVITNKNIYPLLPSPVCKADITQLHISNIYTQKLTHRLVQAQFVHITTKHKYTIPNSQWVGIPTLPTIPLPVIIREYILSEKKHFNINK